MMKDGMKVKVELVGIDVYLDLVVLKINLDKVEMVVFFGDLSVLKVGEFVIVIGFLLGFEYVNFVILGIIFFLN